MPYPIMLTEAAALFGPGFAAAPTRRSCAERPFETLAEMAGVDLDRLDPAARRDALAKCASCACRKACRRWLRTGAFSYTGDPRCPNARLLYS